MGETREYRKFTPQQKLELVLASWRGERSVAEICREHDISESLLRRWREQVLEAGMERFAAGEQRSPGAEQRRRIAELERALGRKSQVGPPVRPGCPIVRGRLPSDAGSRADRTTERDQMPAPAHDSPEQTVDELFTALDRLDLEAIESFLSEDAQGVDELSGGWRRGREALHEYFAQITSAGLADVRSTLSDRHTVLFGDVAIVTLVLDQTYTLKGEPQTIHAPTSIVLRRQPDGWSVALVHTVPVPHQG